VATVSYPAAKRVLDESIALVLLVVLSPVFAFLFVAVGLDMAFRREDRGPWLYRERRISRGSEFDLLKFRTLRRDALATMHGESHARLLEADESNLTWAGRRLLKPWYLDELPQLWNVIRGDMSLVGPRPWPPSMVAAQVARGLTYRNEFVAGWTGPAQVQKGAIETSGYAELDVAYVEAARVAGTRTLLRMDLAILWKTLLVMARGEGLAF
jgi:lipopolysaccharide/colanic/teichoic acid biosynthesis glycosyltransferase